MEYLSDIREFKLLRNYINNDPVCDYFQLQTHLNNNMNFEKDTNNYFNKYVNKVSSDFINDIFLTEEKQQLTKIAKINPYKVPPTFTEMSPDFPCSIEVFMKDGKKIE